MARTTNGIPYPDEMSPYPSRLWWKALAEALDPYIGKLSNLPDLAGLMELLKTKIDKPDGARVGQVLTYNGDTWVAWDSTGGGGDGGGGSVLPISQRGSFLVGTGTDWIVLPGGSVAGHTLVVDPTNGYGYKWGSPMPPPQKGALLAATSDGWLVLTPPARGGLSLISDPSAAQGMKWGSPLPNPSRGSVMVADGTAWQAVPWSGRDGEALIVDASRDIGVKWGGVLPSPLKGAILVGDGIAWRLVTPPIGNQVFVSDPTASVGVRWSSEYAKKTDLELYVTKTMLGEYVKKSEIDGYVTAAMNRRWKGWRSCRLASGWSGSMYVNDDGTMVALKGTVRPGSGAGNTMAYLPTGMGGIYATGHGTHIREPYYLNGVLMVETGGVRPSVITFSGTSISTHGRVETIDTSYGTKVDGCIAVYA